ncbi:hypothetical protein JCM16303_007155 [Sporobolomyces ruberrimus]
MDESSSATRQRICLERSLYMNSRPVISIAAKWLGKKTFAQHRVLKDMAKNLGLLCACGSGGSVKLVFSADSGADASFEDCKGRGWEPEYEDPPRDWEEEDRLDENDDTYYFVPCLDLASTSAAKRAEADKWMHRDWRHNTEWWHLVRIFHDHSSGFFVEPSILAQLKAFHRQVVAESAVSQQQPRPSPTQTDLVVTSMQLSSQTLPKSRLQDAHEVKVRTELDIPIETREEHVNEAAEGSTGLENAMSDLVRSTNMATLSTAPVAETLSTCIP